MLGFIKKRDLPVGEYKWLTVVSPEGPQDIELLLEPNNNPAAKTFQKAIMEIKPIRSEVDYEAALKEIENLLGSQPGTPESDRMDVLVTLVEAYEAKNFPIPLPDDPAEILEYYLESRGLSRSDLITLFSQSPRQRWELFFAAMANLGDDQLLDQTPHSQWDEDEWTW